MAEHFGPEARLRSYQEVPLAPEYTVTYVKDQLESENTKDRNVFVKDEAYAVHGQYHVIPKGYKHTFLTRKPELA